MKKSTILSGFIGCIIGSVAVGKLIQNTVSRKEEKIKKFKTYYNILNQWLAVRQQGGNLSSYFDKNGYNRIAVYGLGELGKSLIAELRETRIEVVYGVDRNIDNVFSDVDVYQLEDIPDDVDVDVFVVTAVFAIEEIEKELSDRWNRKVISLEEVVFGI